MRSDWLKQLNLEAPTTIDEWYEVLTAFKSLGTNEAGGEIIPMVSQKLSSDRKSVV